MIILVDPTSISGAGKVREIYCTGPSSEQSSFGKRLSAFFGQVFCRSVWLFGTAISAIAAISIIAAIRVIQWCLAYDRKSEGCDAGFSRRLALVDPIGLEDWKAKGVPWQSVDAMYQKELKTTADGIREYERTTYYAGTWQPEYEKWVQMLAGGGARQDRQLREVGEGSGEPHPARPSGRIR
jgi:hypothetical protein